MKFPEMLYKEIWHYMYRVVTDRAEFPHEILSYPLLPCTGNTRFPVKFACNTFQDIPLFLPVNKIN